MAKIWKDWSRAEFLKLPRTLDYELKFRALYFFTPGTKHDSGYGDIALFGSRDVSNPEFYLGTCDDLNLNFNALFKHQVMSSEGIHIDANNRGIFRIWTRRDKEFVFAGMGSSRWLTLREIRL